MTLIDFAAILGALAWIPPIAVGLYRILTRPLVEIITQQSIEVGFTNFGPIINVRLAFSAYRREITVADVQIELRHEAGDKRVLTWHGIVQPLSRLSTPAGTAYSEKEQSVLAIKLNTRDIDERMIRFQDPVFHKGKKELIEKILKKITFLKETGNLSIETIAKSQEELDLISFNKQFFNWKSGTYHFQFALKSANGFVLKNFSYEFQLSSTDIELLESNKTLLEEAYKDELLQGTPNYSSPILPWRWRYPYLLMKT